MKNTGPLLHYGLEATRVQSTSSDDVGDGTIGTGTVVPKETGRA